MKFLSFIYKNILLLRTVSSYSNIIKKLHDRRVQIKYGVGDTFTLIPLSYDIEICI